ncbi:MAG: flavin reductase family protein [Treponema sp.]|nr:flavin reductase family protein [Treponema sp.]
MKQITLLESMKNIPVHPVSLICTPKPDGSTNLAAVSWWTFLSSNPQLIGFAMGKNSYTSELLTKNDKGCPVVLSIPGESIADITLKCGSVSGRELDKVKEYGIEMIGAPLKYPAHSRFAYICTVESRVEAGVCNFFICKVDDVLFDETVKQIFAWGGYGKLAPLPEGS